MNRPYAICTSCLPGLRCLTRAEPIAASHAWVTATSQTGACSALVSSKKAHAA